MADERVQRRLTAILAADAACMPYISFALPIPASVTVPLAEIVSCATALVRTIYPNGGLVFSNP